MWLFDVNIVESNCKREHIISQSEMHLNWIRRSRSGLKRRLKIEELMGFKSDVFALDDNINDVDYVPEKDTAFDVKNCISRLRGYSDSSTGQWFFLFVRQQSIIIHHWLKGHVSFFLKNHYRIIDRFLSRYWLKPCGKFSIFSACKTKSTLAINSEFGTCLL